MYIYILYIDMYTYIYIYTIDICVYIYIYIKPITYNPHMTVMSKSGSRTKGLHLLGVGDDQHGWGADGQHSILWHGGGREGIGWVEENHGKTIGKCWFYGILNGIDPSW